MSAALEYLCRESNKLYNCTLYLARQLDFKAGKFFNGSWLSSQMKLNSHMKALYTSAAQPTCISVGKAFKSFKELLKPWRKGELPEKPKPPQYRTSDSRFQIGYPQRWLKLVDGVVKVPMGKACKTWFNLSEVFLPFPTHLDWNQVQKLQIVPRAGYFDVVWIGKGKPVEPVDFAPDKALSIDPGLNNWLTCTTTEGTSFLVDGKHLKSLNQWYNKRVANIKEGKDKYFWCNPLDRITGKRNHQMREAVNQATRIANEHCLEPGIGTIVLGWNQSQKQRSEMGRKTNQKLVFVPSSRLKKRIQQLAEQYGIIFIEQEDSYTSKVAALDLDVIPVFGKKSGGWKPSGKRVKRGLSRSADGTEVNADAKARWNIGRKANVTGMQSTPATGVLTSPKRLR
ncbi:RNA-guided endonuclease TnpB family protein [Geitlerinema sp. PCC 9228]|uniref:RNA-guided endonuclease InsQ/TnpB family protein n=1 Tax=Geitlerinema sp. PCC 9228 TaxID=111611 RepID=UPI0009FC499A|nr:RNA-guided endonuclease TnpB family protein [Geitlerinema sp. PCC 9228]